MRVLDIDLDFFLNDVAHWPPAGERLDSEHFRPWTFDEVATYFAERCKLTRPLPGVAVEEHQEVFHAWRRLIEENKLSMPFHVTHLDAHADLGLGDPGYVYLMTELLFQPMEMRAHPYEGRGGMEPGNFLAFAIANRWVSDVTYVYIPGGGSDLLALHMENYDANAERIQLKAIDPQDESRLTSVNKPEPVALEPAVPIRTIRSVNFQAEAPFDFIFLARSPTFTPPTSDDLYEMIRERYIASLD
jgi:hypothetical protein